MAQSARERLWNVPEIISQTSVILFSNRVSLLISDNPAISTGENSADPARCRIELAFGMSIGGMITPAEPDKVLAFSQSWLKKDAA